jgi:hypothetical protein
MLTNCDIRIFATVVLNIPSVRKSDVVGANEYNNVRLEVATVPWSIIAN